MTSSVASPVVVVGAGPVGLLLCRLLARYRQPFLCIERRQAPRTHPQAHFLHARSLELFRSYCWPQYAAMVAIAAPSHSWRDFVYAREVLGEHFTTEDQFQSTAPSFWLQTPANVLHLPQHNLEAILMRDTPHADSFLFDHELLEIKEASNHQCVLLVRDRRKGTQVMITCQYVVGADGAHSAVRRLLPQHFAMEGPDRLQHLVNVHFTCAGLRKQMRSRSAMLYFTFHEEMVAVYVAHSPEKDEWVCQIPFFPPLQQFEDFTESRLKALLATTIYGHASQDNVHSITILSCNTWTMQAQVCNRFTHPSHRVFLAGDAAHRFPPAGGFGMNTGLQDAHNLAWRLAYLLHGKTERAAMSKYYDQERRKTALETTSLSLKNYHKTLQVARTLGVDPYLATTTVNTLVLLPEVIRKRMFAQALQLGLKPLQWLRSWQQSNYGRWRIQALQTLVHTHKAALPLIFPQQDLHYSYASDQADSGLVAGIGHVKVGRRLPHTWISLLPKYLSDDSLDHSSRSMVIVSSVDLPAAVMNIADDSCDPSTAHKSSPPPFTILLPSRSASDILAALATADRNIESWLDDCVVVVVSHDVHPCRDKIHANLHRLLGQQSPSRLHHRALQEALQIPKFHQPNAFDTDETLSNVADTGSPNIARDQRYSKEYETANLSTENSQRLSVLLDPNPSNAPQHRQMCRDLLHRHPHDQRLKIIYAHIMAENDGNKEDNERWPEDTATVEGIIVRPDGHVGEILGPRSSSTQFKYVHQLRRLVLKSLSIAAE